MRLIYTSLILFFGLSSYSFSGESFDLDDVIEIINRNNIISVDHFIEALPPYMKLAGFTPIAYGAHGLIESSDSFPNIYLAGDSRSSVILALNSNPDNALKPVEKVEVLAFDKKNKQHSLAEISFINGQSPKIEHNPKSCVQCHGEIPRPLWKAGYIWDGFYGSKEDNFFYSPDDEIKSFKKLRKQNNTRIKYIGYKRKTGTYKSPNVNFTTRLAAEHAQVLSRKIFTHPKYSEFKTKIFYTLSMCSQNIENIIQLLSNFDIKPENWFLNTNLKKDEPYRRASFYNTQTFFETGIGPIEHFILSNLIEWDTTLTIEQKALFLDFHNFIINRYNLDYEYNTYLQGITTELPKRVFAPKKFLPEKSSGTHIYIPTLPSKNWCHEFNDKF